MPGSGGRPIDPIWDNFEKIDGKSKCKVCGHEAAANPERMRKHFSRHEEQEGPTRSKQPKITNFATSTSKEEKNKFDAAVGRFFFANNIQFTAVESSQFKELCSMLHPGYKPPTRNVLATEILDK